MPLKYYAHPAFGAIVLKKNRMSKGLRIIIRSSDSITVTFPWHLTYNDAIRFVNEKESWIRDNLKKIRTLVPSRQLLPGCGFRTFAHELLFEKTEAANGYIRVNQTSITVYYTSDEMLQQNEVQEHIRLAVEKVLRIEALKYLPARVDFFAGKFGLKYKGISVKKMRTRWGSCSTAGKLNFNIHLMRLPVHLIDYVIMHELAHLKHHNHGAGFWKYLDEMAGGAAKRMAAEMKKYRTTSY